MNIKDVPAEIAAYANYQWDEQTHRLVSSLNADPNHYGGFEVGLCRPEGALGGRIKVVGETSGADQFTPDNIRKIQGLLGLSPNSSAIILDREANEPGHICLQATDVHWVKMMFQRAKESCKDALGKEDPKNVGRCESFQQTLKSASHSESALEKFWETVPVGFGFAAPAAIGATALVLWKGKVSQWLFARFGSVALSGPPSVAPSIILFMKPSCDTELSYLYRGVMCSELNEI